MKILKELIKEVLLSEEVFGAQAFVYHGSFSPPAEFLDYLLKDKFEAGSGAGAAYGKGLYTVYNLQGTLTAGGQYGDFVYKLKVNLYGFIIFDPDIAKLVYKKELPPSEQAVLLGKEELASKLPRYFSGERLTSSFAQKYSNILTGRVKGIVFTGETDGKVAVIYDPSIVVPVAYKKAIEKEWTPVDRSTLKPAISKSASGEFEEFKYEPKMKKILEIQKLPPEERHFLNLDLSLVRTDFDLPEGITVDRVFDLSMSAITHLPPNLTVGRVLDLGWSRVKSLPSGLKVGEDLKLRGTEIKRLPEDLQVGGSITGFTGPMVNVPKHLKKKITKG